MSLTETRSESVAPDLDLDTVERELAEAEQSLEVRLQLAMRQSETVLGRVRQLAEVAQRSGIAASSPDLRARLDALAAPVLDLSKPLSEARSARMEAIEARKRAHEFMTSALQTGTRRYSSIQSELAAVEAELQRALASSQAARTAHQAQGGAAVTQGRPPPARRPTQEIPPVPVAAPQPAGAERRVDARVRLERTVDLHSDDNFFVGFANDLSVGGLFVATPDRLPRGKVVELVFSLPDGTRIEAEGEVRWTREYNDRVPLEFPGVGIQFKRIAPEAVQAIARFVAKREALFYDD